MAPFVENHSIHFIWRLLIAIILLAICWQDFKKYEVSLWLYPTGFIFFSVPVILQIGIYNYILQLLVNFTFVLLLIGSVWLYFRIKNRKPIKLSEQYIGWGDTLFFIMVAPLFDIMQFVIFLTASFAIALAYAIINYLRIKAFRKVPLAGIMALNLFVFETWLFIKKGI